MTAEECTLCGATLAPLTDNDRCDRCIAAYFGWPTVPPTDERTEA